MDLFDDLPEPTQTSAPVPGARPLSTKEEEEEEEEEEERRFKRRRGDGAEEEQEEVKRVCKEGLPVLRGYVAARRGERDEMQDAHVLLPDMNGYLSALPGRVSRVSYFAVFDGHGGARASRFAAENLHHNLAKKFPSGETENVDKLIKKCLVDTFRQTDEEFLKKASSQKPAWKDGSTATCVLVVDDTVYVANLGDSRVCWDCFSVTTRRAVTLALSKEHNPTIYEERMRIQRAGGTVRDGRVLGVLEVSRSIGDGQYKRCGVISTPDLRRCQLTANDRREHRHTLTADWLDEEITPPRDVTFVPSVSPIMGNQLASEAVRRGSQLQYRVLTRAVRDGCDVLVTVMKLCASTP
ncbi:Integrin-linked kinase-associated serine/threonine phosphatase 2C [Collichthys lucidus]|uniref:Integrin-linked kinase-associated serine/threonine phosphatase 2C n=1 Tax=Collichthys lucidus TaxID=240159 RepID=A0A4U5UYX1_COLLU|nr:Integrin-linked kinase-associated serine/threonine phosphatase 2C [Collichthys lucidus]